MKDLETPLIWILNMKKLLNENNIHLNTVKTERRIARIDSEDYLTVESIINVGGNKIDSWNKMNLGVGQMFYMDYKTFTKAKTLPQHMSLMFKDPFWIWTTDKETSSVWNVMPFWLYKKTSFEYKPLRHTIENLLRGAQVNIPSFSHQAAKRYLIPLRDLPYTTYNLQPLKR